METNIVYIDDDAHALAALTSLLQAKEARVPSRWVLVACAPRITQRVSKWGTNSARANWRGKWAEKMFEQVLPLFQGSSAPVITHVMTGPIDEFTQTLRVRYEGARVLDARKPKTAPESSHVAARFPGSNIWSWVAIVCGPALMTVTE